MLRQQCEDAVRQQSWLDRQRYRPQQWGISGNWLVYPSSAGEPWHLRLANQQRLRELRHAHGHEVKVFCSHDPIEYEQFSGHSMGTPEPALRPA